MYEFKAEKSFQENLEFFCHVILADVFLCENQIVDIVDYLNTSSVESILVDEITEYFQARLDAIRAGKPYKF